jgi:hypothetical protein
MSIPVGDFQKIGALNAIIENPVGVSRTRRINGWDPREHPWTPI